MLAFGNEDTPRVLRLFRYAGSGTAGVLEVAVLDLTEPAARARALSLLRHADPLVQRVELVQRLDDVPPGTSTDTVTLREVR